MSVSKHTDDVSNIVPAYEFSIWREMGNLLQEEATGWRGVDS